MNNYSLLNIFIALLQQFFGVPVLVYHSIGREREDALAPSVFKKHLDFFKNERFTIYSLEDLRNLYNKNGRIKYPSVCLTFDDGYADFFDIVYPLLMKYEFPATVFVIVEKIDSVGYLNQAQLKEISRGGLVTVASHTMGHRDLSLLDSFGLEYEMLESRKKLELLTGVEVKFLAYPWGIFSPHIRDAANEYGYSAAFSTNTRLKGEEGKSDILYSIRRITVSPSDNKLGFIAKASGLALLFPKALVSGAPHE